MRKSLLTAFGAVLLALAGSSPAAADAAATPYSPPAGLTATDLTFRNGGTELHGSVVRRADLDPAVRHPAIVLVHGSGAGPREELGQEAEVFARAGLVTLIYDKRADYTKTHRDYSALADDAVAGVRAVAALPDVDPARTGLWGLSEGGWIAPLAASRSAEAKFLVTIGAPGLPPARTQAWNLINRITRAGVTPSTVDAIVGTGMGLAVATDGFPQAAYDPVPALRTIRQPVLALWGELDTQVPPRESAEVFRRELTASPSVTIRILPHGAHAGRITTDGYDRVGGPTINGFAMGELLPGYGTLMTDWIAQVTGGRLPASAADALPAQGSDSIPVSGVGPLWWAAFATIAMALLSWPVGALVRRLRGGRGRPAGARPARWLVLTGLIALVGGVAYPIMTVATSGKQTEAFLFGQPLAWLVLRAVTVLALLCTAWAVVALRSAQGRDRLRLAVTTAGGLLLVPFALSLGLLLP
ncbi:alpha/beta hydrolase family protein [Catellatospora chokoriensis]|uniref:Peptidase S9 prolyl oligopeptidase catalytic domain-containing protein n=1 Tax=Catellatospora chokoriensis TaxID=310353 RepID=A0A8J3JL68_9ACTN|nr:prolyl oligopeptidase family serine peptidase [Catellatospora chokoriensis]GIF87051.1 hypothetical protein Cch02nite_04950 [Catellatospora chokoriensis]